MRRLSIIIPHLREHNKLETTLVSVLENAPRASEVIVVDACEYADPYELSGAEVRFLPAAAGSGLVELIEIGLSAAESEFVHLLEPGLEVSAGWDEPVLPHFDDPEVASVAPLILDADKRRRIVSSGLQYGRSGRRTLANYGARYRSGRKPRQEALGPHWSAAFYRRSILEELITAGNVVGDKLADLDWALTLRDLGLHCVSEPQAQVFGEPQIVELKTMLDGRHAQRLYRRHLDAERKWSSLARHPWAWFCDFVESVPSLASILVPIGRLAGCFESKEARPSRQLDRGRLLGEAPAPITPRRAA